MAGRKGGHASHGGARKKVSGDTKSAQE